MGAKFIRIGKGGKEGIEKRRDVPKKKYCVVNTM